jgi:hypothetical protein
MYQVMDIDSIASQMFHRELARQSHRFLGGFRRSSPPWFGEDGSEM